MIDNITHNKILESLDKKIINQSKIKNILITGCGGFIGSYLVSALFQKNLKVILKYMVMISYPQNLIKNLFL